MPKQFTANVSGNGPDSTHFLTHIQQYNNCFQMTSFGATKVIQKDFMSTCKEAKETLCDLEKRSNYDKWRTSGISISYKQWLGMKEHVHQSMHWSTPKTKDRMLESGGSSGPSSLGAGAVTAAQRRASEGGANLHWGGRGAGSAWGTEAPSESTKWTSLEVQEKTSKKGGSSGPSSLTAAVPSAAHRRASEGGVNLYMKLANKKTTEKNNEI